jgi:hypothetical protein
LAFGAGGLPIPQGQLVAPTWRTKLGDDGKQIGAHSAIRNPNSALERLFSGIHFGLDDWGNTACQKAILPDN